MTVASARKTKATERLDGVTGETPGPSAVDGRLRDRALGAYLGLAVGDALGATTEFMTPREIRQRHGVHRDLTGGGWLKLKPGRVTDDTEMSLALGRVIIDSGHVSPHAVAEAFSEWMRSKPVDIGSTVRRGISHYRCTGQPEVVSDEHNAGNGACMRCLPVALRHCFSTRTALAEASRLQAHVTHNNAVADAGTETVLDMIVAALRGGDRQRVLSLADGLVERYPQFRFDGRRQSGRRCRYDRCHRRHDRRRAVRRRRHPRTLAQSTGRADPGGVPITVHRASRHGAGLKTDNNRRLKLQEADFHEVADEFINLANELSDDWAKPFLSAAFMYAAARYNAHFFYETDGEAGKRADAIDYYCDQYRKMLHECMGELAAG